MEQRFNLWIGRQKKAGNEFTKEQLDWLQLIRNHIAANAEISPRDFMEIPSFTDRGGLLQAQNIFGAAKMKTILDELQEALVG